MLCRNSLNHEWCVTGPRSVTYLVISRDISCRDAIRDCLPPFEATSDTMCHSTCRVSLYLVNPGFDSDDYGMINYKT